MVQYNAHRGLLLCHIQVMFVIHYVTALTLSGRENNENSLKETIPTLKVPHKVKQNQL